MNRSRVVFLVVSLVVLVPVVTGVLWSAASERDPEVGEDSLYKYLAIFSEVFGLVRHNYVDQTEPGALLAGAMEGATNALDPFSAYVPAHELADYRRALEIGRSRSGLTVVRDHGIAFVLAIEEGSPGAAAKLEPGDILTEIEGRSTRDMPLWQLARVLAAEPGTKLPLRVLRQGDALEVELALAEYSTPEARLEEIRGLPLLRVPSFGDATTARVRALLQELATRQAPRLLVDLRGVAGGSSAAGYATAGLFAAGELGRLKGRGEDGPAFHGDSAPAWQGEMVVLVDGGTQGAAEILASALHDRAQAKVVGVRTFGWAGELGWVELETGDRLHLTTGFYTAPDGTPLAEGVTPDLLVDDLQRRFDERDKPLTELILERGVELLLGADESARRAA